MDKIVVTKSNHLIEAGYKLSLNEQRLILSAISRIDARKPIPKYNEFVITASDFSKTFRLPLKQSYEILEEAASRLYEQDIKTYDRTAKTLERFRWIDRIKYWTGEAKVTLSFSRWVIPYLTMLHRQFTSYDLNQISQLNTAYAIRFYELLTQFSKTGERYIALDRLREILELKEQYQRFFDFKKRIIDPSISEINSKTNLTVDWDVSKKGRIIKGLLFVFQSTYL